MTQFGWFLKLAHTPAESKSKMLHSSTLCSLRSGVHEFEHLEFGAFGLGLDRQESLLAFIS